MYLQQNAFDPVDAATPAERQRHMFDLLMTVLLTEYKLPDKEAARNLMNQIRQKYLDWNGCEWNGDRFKELEKEIRELVLSHARDSGEAAEARLKKLQD